MQKKRIFASTLLLCLCLTTVGCNKQNIDDAKELHDMHDEMVRISDNQDITKTDSDKYINNATKKDVKEVVKLGDTTEYCGVRFTINKVTVNESVSEALKSLELYDDELFEDIINHNGPNSLGGRLYGNHELNENGSSRFGELIVFEMTIENVSNVSRMLDFGGVYGFYIDDNYINAGSLGEIYSNISTFDQNEMALHTIKSGEKINKIIILCDRVANIRDYTMMSLNGVCRVNHGSGARNPVKEDILMDFGLHD
ncbi:MAG: hypothetical protein ACI4E1_04755 [Lachnospira sp.]